MASHRPNFTRRQFLQVTASAAASTPFLLPSRVWGADTAPNSRLTLASIGVGTQGRFLLDQFLRHPNTQVVAVCDVDGTRRQHSQNTVNKFYSDNKDFKGCTGYNDFRELLARSDVDAVIIATPDHWHEIPVIAAAKAGKDIYCEKPLSLTIPEARRMVKAIRENNRVFQTGSMQRSMSEFHKACELVRNGRLGKITKIEVGIGGPSKWCDLPEEAAEPGLDWDFWLGPAPKRAYNSVLSPRGVHTHFPNWRGYREYSGGSTTDWGAHHYDIAQWGLGMDESGPIEIIPPADPKAETGLVFRYANGVEMVHGSPRGGGVLFHGTEGTLFVDRGKFEAKPESLGKEVIPDNGIHLYKSTNHYADFLKAIRTRTKPICDVEVGCRSVSVCHLANLAYWNHRTLKWDPAAERFVGDAEANTWLERKNRDPWKSV